VVAERDPERHQMTINFYSADATRIIRTRTYRTVALAMRAVARAAKRGIPTARAL
jgi:hypothetical protein